MGKPKGTKHKLSIDHDPANGHRGHLATCRCSWRGIVRNHRAAAEKDYRDHVSSANRQETGGTVRRNGRRRAGPAGPKPVTPSNLLPPELR